MGLEGPMSLDQALVDQLGRFLPKMVRNFATAKGEANPAQKQQLPKICS